jgi:DNA-binding response OmpR family regulator
MNRKVVIVEDDQLLGIVLEKMANSLDLDVLEISQTGSGAVASIQKHNPDLIFMDIQLADDINGIQAMEQIRNHSNAPVIYITGQSDLNTRKRASQIQNSFFMIKPVNIHDLKSAINGGGTPSI